MIQLRRQRRFHYRPGDFLKSLLIVRFIFICRVVTRRLASVEWDRTLRRLQSNAFLKECHHV